VIITKGIPINDNPVIYLIQKRIPIRGEQICCFVRSAKTYPSQEEDILQRIHRWNSALPCPDLYRICIYMHLFTQSIHFLIFVSNECRSGPENYFQGMECFLFLRQQRLINPILYWNNAEDTRTWYTMDITSFWTGARYTPPGCCIYSSSPFRDEYLRQEH